MIGFILYTLIILLAGIVLGETKLITDIAADLRRAIQRRRAPKPTLPLVRILYDTQWRRLKVPTVRRRTQIPVVRE